MAKAKKNEGDCEYKTQFTVEKKNIEMELLEPQIHENIAVIPIKTKASKLDILTVKKGFELGLISIDECEKSTVGQIVVTNNSISPLILVDGDEIIGAKQNRIVNNTTLVGPKSSINLSVSCVEQGRWAYTDSFKVSANIATSKTRSVKAKALYSNMNAQSEVWDSISSLEERNSFHSSTQAMSESYDRLKAKHDKYVKKFERIKGQSGAMVFVNGEFEGMDVFINPQIYGEYHEKILKSYIIDKDDSNQETVNKYDLSIKALEILEAIETSEIKENKTQGIGRSISFSNEIGTGSALIYKDKVLHIPFLKHPEIMEKN
ncbi:ARPP-1 family domain-containing protein [Methanobrevibacter millerae]|uniref:ARG and Rhodanese-Phosphatase-superfamily-associated domain-containing protein n=1 Tax=Methanobrevibacter millerae TaxID=230361 RepID=A0A1G5UWD9_9EURY|nr:DUF6569 family protein [Methanobrevibacter millerae]SDA37095.1 hypothetical protein SAMN02910315_00041 [Methanobrevibacter millerae]